MKQQNIVKVGIIGTGQRAEALAGHLKTNSDARITALCDINSDRLYSFSRQYNLEQVTLTTEIDEFLADNVVDAVIITVPDRFHKEVAVKCFAAGKDVMLEKPMALTVADCREIIRAKEKADKVLLLGFILRCTPFYKKIKQLIDEGRLGQIMSISAAEFLGVDHSAAYMRRWHRKKANCGSFLLVKSSHDVDLLNWLMSSLPTHVASFGDNNFFLPSKQPASHCSICPVKDSCPYKFKGGFVFMTEADKANPSKRDFDLCVYNDDKDIVDNQVCILQYTNNIRATFSLQLFHPEESKRYITINGTDAYLTGCLESNIIKLQEALTGQVKEFDLSSQVTPGHHAGGDAPFTREFIETVKTGKEPVANLRDGLTSTVVSMAIEKGRAEMKVVEIDPAEYQL